MRADRLVAIVLLLQAHGQLTAGQLAERLETAERTVRRDLEALCMAGVPLYSQRGRGGGWALLAGHRTDLTGLTADEAQALYMATAPGAAGLLGPGASAGLAAARRKVLAALPATLREQVVTASRTLLFDASRWGQRARDEGARGDPEQAERHLPELRRAVFGARQVVIAYGPPGRPVEERQVQPHGLVCKRGVWYLVATAAAGLRTYRVSRAQSVRVTDEPVHTPPGFDLAEAWASAQRAFFERLPAATLVELAVAPSQLRRLEAIVGAWWPVSEQGAGPDGRARVVVGFPNPRLAATGLVALADHLEVLSPDEVRQEMAERGRRLISAYGASNPPPSSGYLA